MTRFSHITIVSWLTLSCYLCHLALGQSNISNVKCFDTERKALLQFKDGIVNDGINGDYCGLLASWGNDNDCCQWRGVHCDNYTAHVIMLILPGYHSTQSSQVCLSGELNPSLGKLTYLRHLNLNFNFFPQPVLDFLGPLTNLEHLSLRETFFSNGSRSSNGDNSQWLSRLNSLRYLDLSGADLSNAKNWTQIVSQLSLLDVLKMDECSLPKNIPSSLPHINSSSNLRVISLSGSNVNDSNILRWLFSLKGVTTRLVYLDLSSNLMGGSIPNGFENLKQLSHLDLSYNNLEGPIPNGFGNLYHLSHLDFSNNLLESPIPIEFRDMQSLSYLSLSQNHLQGSVFEIFTSLCNLQQLYLGTNNFTDELTNVVRALHSCENSALQILDLSQNRFRGVIPNTIASFSLVRELYLDGNQLSGGISQGIGQLGMLEKLDISSNLLEATLTHTHFLNLSRLRELYLSKNPRLVIKIDATWDPPFQLDIISLGSCKLGPYFPNWLQKQTNFSSLDVSNAEISGSLHVSFWNTLPYNFQYLNMSYNHLSGLIPNLTKRYFFDRVVDLSSNLFVGALPSWLTYSSTVHLHDNRFTDFSDFLCPKTRSSLLMVDLSNNMLTGELPDCWTNISQLISLHLENNRLFGNIPKSIGALNNLESLHLHNNSFSGPIPDSLENCRNLIFLNLGYNSFSGNIPPWIGNVKSLGVLILRRNNFVGEIPPSLCQLPRLQILDLANNHVSGEIPKCISNLTSMSGSPVRMFLSSYGTTDDRVQTTKDFETAIVTWKREEQMFKDSVIYVISIDFSCNELDGKIPDGIYNLTGLVSLDLSNNSLSGSIASEIEQLTALQLLDFSNNHLTGQIPASLAKLSFLGILDLSNNNLSGKIPVSTQLQSFSAASYLGNSGLCGDPLSKCPRDQASINTLNGDSVIIEDAHHDYAMFPGLYIAVVLGFITGFWGVCGSLVIKTSWRHAWFRFLNEIRDRFYVISMGIIAKAGR